MDFFAQQDQARAWSRRLVWLFALAVGAVVLAVNLAVGLALGLWLDQSRHRGVDTEALRWQVHVVASLGTLAVIGLGSLYKSLQLRAGGRVVAEMLGARPVSGAPRDAQERQLLNVVEEMSLASGVPLPAVYVIDEDGINAFAAGLGQEDAVVAVTRGSLARLSRDELQGVVAHEFSHILNGDMRLNLRLIGVVHGILVIGLLGYMLLRFMPLRGGGRKEGGGGVVIALLAAGVALLVIGYVGTFIGGLIKAAVSRRREHLADAAAVQFTRNPAGIAGALKKLGGAYARAFVDHQRSPEFSHLFFGRAQTRPWFGLLDTHPPLEERIRAIEPGWNGSWTPVGGAAAGPAPAGAAGFAGRVALRPEQVADRVGAVPPGAVAFGARLLAAIPDRLREEARDPFSARAVVLALLLDRDPAKAALQFDLMERAGDAPLLRQVRLLRDEVAGLGPQVRLPLLDLCAPALRQLGAQPQTSFQRQVQGLVEADGTVTPAEYLISRLVCWLGRPPSATGTIWSLRPLLPHLALLLTVLARAGSRDEAAARSAFASGAARVQAEGGTLELLEPGACTHERLDRAFEQLRQANGALKRKLVEACAWCVAADGVVTIQEAELLRLTSVALGCPLPPFADGVE